MKNHITYENVGQLLVERIPEFRLLYEEHIKDNDVVLPHVLFGDFTRFVIDVFRKSKNNVEQKSVFERSIHFIKDLLESNNSKLEELAQVSLIENLHQAGSDFAEIKKYLARK